MPSVEIICIDQREALDCSSFTFAVETDHLLKSHRSPVPLFQSDFDRLRGVIYHLMSPSAKNSAEAAKIAYDLFVPDIRTHTQTELIEFEPAIRIEMEEFLNLLLEAAPSGRILFTTDWQFGPDRPFWADVVTIREFWHRHDTNQLRFNSAYPIVWEI